MIQSLRAAVAEKGCDLVHRILVGIFYGNLKDTIIDRAGLSDQQLLDTLFTNVGIGDRKLSPLFRYIKEFLGSHKMGRSLLRYL